MIGVASAVAAGPSTSPATSPATSPTTRPVSALLWRPTPMLTGMLNAVRIQGTTAVRVPYRRGAARPANGPADDTAFSPQAALRGRVEAARQRPTTRTAVGPATAAATQTASADVLVRNPSTRPTTRPTPTPTRIDLVNADSAALSAALGVPVQLQGALKL